jgi:hypothetical protein
MRDDDFHHCFYCGIIIPIRFMEKDHFPKPFTVGGSTVVLSCQTCHGIKHMKFDNFSVSMIENSMPSLGDIVCFEKGLLDDDLVEKFILKNFSEDIPRDARIIFSKMLYIMFDAGLKNYKPSNYYTIRYNNKGPWKLKAFDPIYEHSEIRLRKRDRLRD